MHPAWKAGTLPTELHPHNDPTWYASLRGVSGSSRFGRLFTAGDGNLIANQVIYNSLIAWTSVAFVVLHSAGLMPRPAPRK